MSEYKEVLDDLVRKLSDRCNEMRVLTESINELLRRMKRSNELLHEYNRAISRLEQELQETLERKE